MFAVDDLKILLTSVGENDLTFSPAFWFVSSDSLRFGGRVDVTMLRWLVGARVDCSRGLRARSVACNPRCRQ